MKKLTAWLLLASVLLGMTGCGNSTVNTAEETAPTVSEPTPTLPNPLPKKPK